MAWSRRLIFSVSMLPNIVKLYARVKQNIILLLSKFLLDAADPV